MEIKNSDYKDIHKIIELYGIASNYMKLKSQVVWPEFSRDLITAEIIEQKQWKLLIDKEIACIWVTTTNDDLIWGVNNDKALYIHRIATNPFFRGRKFVNQIVKWAESYCIEKKLNFIRLDTVGLNYGLIAHYEKFGLKFLGTKVLTTTEGLPNHYNEGPVCLFERKINDVNNSK